MKQLMAAIVLLTIFGFVSMAAEAGEIEIRKGATPCGKIESDGTLRKGGTPWGMGSNSGEYDGKRALAAVLVFFSGAF